MKKQVAQFTGVSRLSITSVPDGKSSKFVAADFFLEVSPNLDKSIYIEDGGPTKEGVKPLTLAFVHGLVGNIHFAHEQGYWDSAEHLRYIMAELTRGFAEVAKTSIGDFNTSREAK